MNITFHQEGSVPDAEISFVTIVCKYKNFFVFCRQHQSELLEIPGGKRDGGETLLESAKRELYEETGATDFNLYPIAVFSGDYDIKRYGKLYFAEIKSLETLPNFEMEEIVLVSEVPKNLRWPYTIDMIRKVAACGYL